MVLWICVRGWDNWFGSCFGGGRRMFWLVVSEFGVHIRGLVGFDLRACFVNSSINSSWSRFFGIFPTKSRWLLNEMVTPIFLPLRISKSFSWCDAVLFVGWVGRRFGGVCLVGNERDRYIDTHIRFSYFSMAWRKIYQIFETNVCVYLCMCASLWGNIFLLFDFSFFSEFGHSFLFDSWQFVSTESSVLVFLPTESRQWLEIQVFGREDLSII